MVIHNEAEIRDHRGIENVFINYFSRLFTSSNPNAIDDVVECYSSRISVEQNIFLMLHILKRKSVWL